MAKIYMGSPMQAMQQRVEDIKKEKQVQQEMQSNYNFTANKDFRKEFMDWYQQLLSDNTDPSVRKRLLENPYLTASLRQKTGWEDFTEQAGFGSKWLNELAAAEQEAKNYATQVIEQNRVQDLEAPVSQAQRQLDAGINPDINGGIDSGRIPDFDDQATGLPDSIYGGYDQTSLQDFSSVAMSGVQMIMSLITGVQSLKTNGVNIEAAELALSEQYMDAGNRMVANDFGKMTDGDKMALLVEAVNNRFKDTNHRLSNASSLDDIRQFIADHNKTYKTDLTLEDIMSQAFIKEARKRDFSFIYGRRTRKQLERYYNAIDPENPEIKAMVGDWLNRKSQGNMSVIEYETMLDRYLGGVMKLQQETDKMRLEADKEYAAYQKKLYEEYLKTRSYDGEDGTTTNTDYATMQADAEFEAYAAEKLAAKRQELDDNISLQENSMIDDIYKGIDESKDLQGWQKSSLKYMLMMVRKFVSGFAGSAATGLGHTVSTPKTTKK